MAKSKQLNSEIETLRSSGTVKPELGSSGREYMASERSRVGRKTSRKRKTKKKNAVQSESRNVAGAVDGPIGNMFDSMDQEIAFNNMNKVASLLKKKVQKKVNFESEYQSDKMKILDEAGKKADENGQIFGTTDDRDLMEKDL